MSVTDDIFGVKFMPGVDNPEIISPTPTNNYRSLMCPRVVCVYR